MCVILISHEKWIETNGILSWKSDSIVKLFSNTTITMRRWVYVLDVMGFVFILIWPVRKCSHRRFKLRKLFVPVTMCNNNELIAIDNLLLSDKYFVSIFGLRTQTILSTTHKTTDKNKTDVYMNFSHRIIRN